MLTVSSLAIHSHMPVKQCVVVVIVGASFSTGVILLPHFFRDDARLMWVTDTVCGMVVCV